MDDYHGVQLPTNECDTMHELERQIGVPIPLAPAKRYDFGFGVKHGHVTALHIEYHPSDEDHNAVSELPRGLWSFERLESLDLGYNPLSTIPEEIGRLTSLKELNLNKMGLKRIPEAVGALTKLRTLGVWGNGFDGRSSITKEDGTPLELPDTLGNLKALKALGIDENSLKTLPGWIGQLTALEMLSASGNILSTMPEEIFHLPALKSLNLSENKLISLPDSIGNLEGLEELYLSENGLVTLPAGIGSLKPLKVLDLHDNRFSTIPEGICTLPALDTLYLETNRLVSVPDDIQRLVSLKILHLSGNDIKILPDSLRQLPALKELEVEPRLKGSAIVQALKDRKVYVIIQAEDSVRTEVCTGNAILADFPAVAPKVPWKVTEENILEQIPEGKLVKISSIIKALNVTDVTEARFLELRLKQLVDQGKIGQGLRNGKPYYKKV